MNRERILAIAAFITVCLVWGTTYLAIRVAIETLPTLLLAGTRFTIAGAVLLAACAILGREIPRHPRAWLNFAITGFLMVGMGNVAVVYAEHHIQSGFVALLVATAPIWMVVLEAMRRDGERLDRRKVIGMLIGFIGVGLLVAPDIRPSSFDRGFFLGLLALQAGTICWDLGSIRSKYHPVKASPLVAAAIQMLAGGTIVTVMGLLSGEAASFRFDGRSIVAFLYLVVFGSILAYGAYVYALSRLPTTTVSLYAYVNPVVAVILGWAILDEPLGWRAILSMVVILSGVSLVQTRGRRRVTFAQSPAVVEPGVQPEV